MQTKRNFTINALFIFVSVLIGNVCNFLFNFFIARFLPVESYGIYSALASIIFSFVVIQTPVQNYVISVLSANITHDKENDTFYHFLYHEFLLFFGCFSILPISVSFITGYILQLPVLDCFLMISSNFLFCFSSISFGIMQSFNDRKDIFLYNILFNLLKVLCCLPVAFITGSLSATLLILCIVYFFTSLFFFSKTKFHFNAGDSTGYYKVKTACSYIVKSVPVYVCFSLLQLQDVLIVKYFCSPYETGLYSSASVIGKTVIYLPSAIVIALFPAVSEQNANGVSSLPLFKKSIVLNLVLSGGGAFFLFLTAKWLIPFLFGQKYIEAVDIIKYLGLAFMPLSMIMIFFTFFLAKNKFNCIIPMMCSVFAEFIITYFYHDSLLQIIISIFVSGCVGCAVFFLLVVFEYLKSKGKNLNVS